MRKYTGKEVHGVVDEGRTGRVIARGVLRKGLGNPKNRVVQLRDFGLEMYMKGVQAGAAYMRGRIQNSVAALSYGPGYFVAPQVEGQDEVNAEMVRAYGVDPESDGPLADAAGPANSDEFCHPHCDGHSHDPEAGAFPSS